MAPLAKTSSGALPRVLGRYLVLDEIGAGGMASVHLALHLGPLGFRRTVALKRLHPPLAKDADFFAEVFMHEWAHCRTACDCVDPHCEHWGVEYAACYRACIER